LADLEVPLYQQDKFIFSADIAPGSTISIIRRLAHEIVVSEATWWLMLDPNTLKPNYKYSSFNSRSQKLHTPRSRAFRPYRESRRIILGTAFIEGKGDGRTYHTLEIPHPAVPFGGGDKEWVNAETGEQVLSASIITLPPPMHKIRVEEIHPNSMPLVLPYTVEAYNHWL